eukprot:scaffold45691_cov214-Amphora_coffeaeformis.AAC.1
MEIYCTRDVDAGQEVFLQYTQEGVAMDEIKALWTYIQWVQQQQQQQKPKHNDRVPVRARLAGMHTVEISIDHDGGGGGGGGDEKSICCR